MYGPTARSLAALGMTGVARRGGDECRKPLCGAQGRTSCWPPTFPDSRPIPLVTLRRLLAILVVLGMGALAPRSSFAQSVDVIRGRVIGPDSLPVEGADVTVTSLSGNVNRPRAPTGTGASPSRSPAARATTS